MNMLKQILVFERLQEVNGLTPGQCRLWYALMYIDNLTGWQEWFTVASLTLEHRCRMSKNGLLKARKGLIELGYLEVQSNGRKAPAYRLTNLVDRYSTRNEPISNQPSVAASTPTPGAQPSRPSARPLSRAQNSSIGGPLFKPNTKINNQNHRQTVESPITQTQSFQTWSQNWGQPTQFIQSQLGQWIKEFGDELVNWAIESALSHMVSNDKAYYYLTKVFQSYREKGISTVMEAEAEREQHRNRQSSTKSTASHPKWRRPRRVEKRPSWMTDDQEVKMTTPEQAAAVRELIASLHEQETEPAKSPAY